MPGQRFHGALINLYLDGEAPWKYSRWKEITGIEHGLFPVDDSDLPAGLSREDANAVKSFFTQYSNCTREDERIKFASPRRGQVEVPGRGIWHKFATRLWEKGKLHNLIVEGLRDADIHPASIMIDGSPGGGYPDANMYIAKGIDTIDVRLFGHDGLDNGRVKQQHRPAVQSFAMRTWENLKSKTLTARKNLPQLAEQAKQALEGITDTTFTATKLRKAMNDVRKFVMAAELSGSLNDRKVAEEYKAEIDKLFLVSAKPKEEKNPVYRPKGLCKITRQNLLHLASNEDVQDLQRLYRQFFSEEDGIALEDVVGGDPALLKILDEGPDLGAEEEALMPPDVLSIDLGFKDCLPLLFNNTRHTEGFNPWDNADYFSSSSPSYIEEKIQPLSLHWHQLAGVHGVIRKLFTSEKVDVPSPLSDEGFHTASGMLLADKVGLGKTAMAISIIAFLSHLVYTQERGQSIPPIIRRLPYLGPYEKVPSFPHIIVVPGTLLDQWEKELKTFFLPRKVDIVLYYSDKTSRTEFWNSQGPFNSSIHDAHQKIILASDTAVQADFTKAYYSRVETSKPEPWKLPVRKASSIANTVYAQKFLSVTFDEAHRYRNAGGPRHFSALRLQQNAIISLACTATPLQTSPKDVAQIARLIKISHFSTLSYLDEEKEDASRIRRAKRSEDPNMVEIEQHRIVKRLQSNFEGRILRRTTRSQTWDGGGLLNLPPLITLEGLLTLSQKEADIMSWHAKRAKENASSANGQTGNILMTSKFYLEYRMSCLFPRKKNSEPFPKFQTMQDYEENKSTKLDVFLRICKHYLERDDAPDISFEDGKLITPPMPIVGPGQDQPTQTRRVCAYMEFTHFRPLIEQVMTLHGIQFLWLDGDVPMDKRAGIVEQFYAKDGPRLLIFSSVAAAGMNLAIADKIIQIDVCWSAQDMRQINGRVHRQPQKKPVHAIHLIAGGTSDPLIFCMAKGKKNMLESFVNKNDGAAEPVVRRRTSTRRKKQGIETPKEQSSGAEEGEHHAYVEQEERPADAKKGKGRRKTASVTTAEPAPIAPQVVPKTTTLVMDPRGDVSMEENGHPALKKQRKARKKRETVVEDVPPAQATPIQHQEKPETTGSSTLERDPRGDVSMEDNGHLVKKQRKSRKKDVIKDVPPADPANPATTGSSTLATEEDSNPIPKKHKKTGKKKSAVIEYALPATIKHQGLPETTSSSIAVTERHGDVSMEEDGHTSGQTNKDTVIEDAPPDYPSAIQHQGESATTGSSVHEIESSNVSMRDQENTSDREDLPDVDEYPPSSTDGITDYEGLMSSANVSMEDLTSTKSDDEISEDNYDQNASGPEQIESSPLRLPPSSAPRKAPSDVSSDEEPDQKRRKDSSGLPIGIPSPQPEIQREAKPRNPPFMKSSTTPVIPERSNPFIRFQARGDSTGTSVINTHGAQDDMSASQRHGSQDRMRVLSETIQYRRHRELQRSAALQTPGASSSGLRQRQTEVSTPASSAQSRVPPTPTTHNGGSQITRRLPDDSRPPADAMQRPKGKGKAKPAGHVRRLI